VVILGEYCTPVRCYYIVVYVAVEAAAVRRLPLPNDLVSPGVCRQVDILPISDDQPHIGGSQFLAAQERVRSTA